MRILDIGAESRMADNSLPDRNLPSSTVREEKDRYLAGRRALLRRAAIGLPVILATVHGRTAWAQGEMSAGCAASAHPSGCALRGF